MAEQDDPAEAAARLEHALERIARLAHAPPAPPSVAQPNTAAVAARLDALITQLRAGLGVRSGQ